METTNNKVVIIKYILICSLIIFLLFSPLYSGNATDNIAISLDEKQVEQGGIIRLKLTGLKEGIEPDKIQVIFNDKQFPLFHTDNTGNNKAFATIIGVSYWTSPGQKQILVKAKDNIIASKDIKILKGNFPVSRITVSKEKEKVANPGKEDTELKERLKKDGQLITKARRSTSNKQLWKEGFIWPLKGKISTKFGATRYVNDNLNSRHSGIDIAAQKGTPVVATNTGIVKLAAELLRTGNTIIIDHGQGVFSSYSHLSQVNVEQGESVDKGDKIGEIGSTGFSTGPHLHWVIKANGVFVNPQEFIDE